jgi:uncharacterized membrane protein
MVSRATAELIRKKHPEWGPGQWICNVCLNRFRAEYVEDSIEEHIGELSSLETAVIQSVKEQELLSRNVEEEFKLRLTFGERVADRMADFGGSWRFLFLFTGIICLWILFNSAMLLRRPFDPYPYILLNLILSCLAALQAPVIMMSQNRQEEKDRVRAQHDYQVNLKAEIEIRQLHMKIDQLISHQWQRLLEIQKIQTDIMEDLTRRSVK